MNTIRLNTIGDSPVVVKKGSQVQSQEKTVEITENGTTEVVPDSGYALLKVTVNTNVQGGSGGGSSEYIFVKIDDNADVNSSAILMVASLASMPFWTDASIIGVLQGNESRGCVAYNNQNAHTVSSKFTGSFYQMCAIKKGARLVAPEMNIDIEIKSIDDVYQLLGYFNISLEDAYRDVKEGTADDFFNTLLTLK